jgi:tRNA threonylcarbamoyladenosine biosynthesis protein TsaE
VVWKYLRRRRGFGLAIGQSTGDWSISVVVYLADTAATLAFGRQLVERLSPDSTLLLMGDLGAGKTCLVQGLASGLGIREPITSPTFALAQHYRPADRAAGGLVHLDLYRLEFPAAADELFAQEEEEARALGALLAVEWPERLSGLPLGCWHVRLNMADPANPDAGRQLELIPPR